MTRDQIEAVNAEVRALETMDLETLRLEWRRRYGRPPKLRSVRLLALMLAWKIQVGAFGGLDADLKRRLSTPGAKVRNSVTLTPGAVLTREWKGAAQVVRVTDDGCIWEGRTYRSLSAVARAITGVRWNGPQFFGMRKAGADR